MSAVIFSGTSVKSLKAALNLNGNATISSGNVDPTSSATAGVPGDAYISTLTNAIYLKQDSGTTVNWKKAPISVNLSNGAVPFADASGNLTQDVTNLSYNSVSHQLSSASVLSNGVTLGSAANQISGLSTIVNTGTITLPTATDTLVARATTDTLSNKSLIDNSTSIVGNLDATKKIVFSAAGNTTGITQTISSAASVARTLTLPDATDTLVARATADTLTNKTISGASNTLSNIADGSLSTSYVKADGSRALTGNWGAGAFSITANSVVVGGSANAISGVASLTSNTANPAATGVIRLANADAIKLRNAGNTADIAFGAGSSDSVPAYGGVDIVNLSATQTLTNKTISGSSNTLSNIADGSLSTSYVKADGTRALTGNWSAGAFSITANSVALGNAANSISGVSQLVNGAATLTLPSATDTLVGRATSDTLSNKSIVAGNSQVVDGTDNTKQLKFQTSGATTSTALTLASVQTAARTLTLPDATDTLVARATTDTLTNKTISGSNNTLSNIADTSLSVSYLKADGTRALTGNWNAGAFSVTANSVVVGGSANAISGVASLTSNSANAASTGVIRLANADAIKFRNVGNTADIALGAGSSDAVPAYGGVDIVNLSTSQSLSNKSLVDNSTNIVGNADATKKIAFTAGGNTTGVTLTLAGAATVARTLTLPDATDTLVGRATTDTLTNKTISGSSNTLSNIADGSLSTSYIKADGTRALTGSWNAGAFTITANTFAANTSVTLNGGANNVTLNAQSGTAAYTLSLPNAAPSLNGQVLSATTAGVGSWSTVTTASTGDIQETSFTIANNQSVAANVTGLSFSTTGVRSAFVLYSVYRTTSSAELAEQGELRLVYKNTAATWNLAQTSTGDASGVTFSVTSAGQVQYTSTNVAGTGYTGTMHFRAFVTTQ